MKKVPLLLKTFLIFFILNLIPLPINAQSGQQNNWPMANFIFDYAKTLYERGDLLNARYEFNVLLLLDPNNTLAKYYLKQMSPEAKELYRIGEKAKPAEPGLKEQNRRLRAAVNQFREEIVNKSMRIAAGDAASRAREIGRALSDAEHYVYRMKGYVQESRRRQQAFRAALQEKEIEAAEKGRQLASIREYLKRLEHENRDKDRQLAQLQAFKQLELADFKARVAQVRDILQAQEMETAALNRELKLQQEGMDKRLLERELELAEKYREIEQLDIRLKKTNLELEQAEQDKLNNALWIEQLRNTVKQLEEASSDQLTKYLKKINSLEDALKSKEAELVQLKMDFDLRRQKLQEQLSAKSSGIEELGAKINDYQKKLVVLESSLKVKEGELAEMDEKIKGLNKQSSEYQDKIRQMGRQLSSNDGQLRKKSLQIEELDKKLNLSKAGLEGAKEAQSDRDKSIAQLEAQIKKLKNREQQLSEKVSQAESLDSQLQELRTQIETLQSGSSSLLSAKEKEIASKDARIGELSSQLELIKQKEAQIAPLLEQDNDRKVILDAVLEKLQENLRPEIEANRIKVELTERGIVLSMPADPFFFNPGSAELLPEGERILEEVSWALEDIGGDNHIVIEGHTDNLPIRYSAWKSNWELSTARALAVLHQLLGREGLSPERFSVKGYGEYRPVTDNSSEQLRRQNRRVEIVIQPSGMDLKPQDTASGHEVTMPASSLSQEASF